LNSGIYKSKKRAARIMKKHDLIFRGMFWDNMVPSMFFWSNHGDEEIIPISTGNISFDVGTSRMCTGTFDLKDRIYLPCPSSGKAMSHGAKCINCSKQEEVITRKLGSLAVPSDIEIYLNREPHILYAALLGRTLIKVGIAAEWRKWQRALEQEAQAVVFLLRGNGIEIRKIEEYLVRQGWVDRVLTRTKSRSILEVVSESEAVKLLTEARDTILASIKSGHLSGSLIENEPPKYLVPYYRVPDDALREIWYIGKHVSANGYSGEVIGWAGQLLFLKQNEKVYCLNTRLLQGYLMTVSNTIDQNFVVTGGYLIKRNAQYELF
jgi:hypothetical protein